MLAALLILAWRDKSHSHRGWTNENGLQAGPLPECPGADRMVCAAGLYYVHIRKTQPLHGPPGILQTARR